MPTLSFNKFRPFVEDLAEGKHDFSTHTLKIALSNTEPSPDDGVLADIVEISYTNLSSRTLTVSSSGQASGLYVLVVDDLPLSASGGTVGPFQYIVVFNEDAPADELVGWYDYGSPLSLDDGDTVNLDFSDVLGLLDIE